MTNLVRVYVPATVPLVASLQGGPELKLPAASAHAVTPALREWYTEGDQEELEYLAFTRAAQEALRLLHDDPAAPRRRVVVSADVAPQAVHAESQELGTSAVRLSMPVTLSAIASFHIDAAEAEAEVTAAAQVVELAGAGDDEAQFVVDSTEDHDLLWYAPEELGEMLRTQA